MKWPFVLIIWRFWWSVSLCCANHQYVVDSRFEQVIDPDLKDQFSILRKSPKFPIVKKAIRVSSDVIQSKRDLSSDSDLWGEAVKVEGRQLGQSLTQVGPDGHIIGFKEPGVFVPWGRQPIIDPNSSTTEEPTVTTVHPKLGPGHLLPKLTVSASSLFGGCGATRTCFAYPEGCIETRTCRVAGSIFEEDDDHDWVKVTIAAAAPNGFVAIGFSDDRFMGDDIVVHCNHVPNGSQMSLHLSVNKGYQSFLQKDQKRFESSLSPIAGFVQKNGVIACEFNMSTTIFLDENDPNGTDLKTKNMHLFLAFGRYVSNVNDSEFGQLRWHDLVVVTDEKIRFDDIFKTPKILYPRGRTYILLHVIPYILAFSFFNPCAIFIAKYGREAYGQLKTAKLIPLWLLIHVSFQITAIILSLVGLIAILIELGWSWRSATGKAIFHSVFGIFGTIFIWFNALFGAMGLRTRGIAEIARVVDSGRKYHYFRWMHWCFGNSVYVFGMGSLLIAIYMRRAHAPCLFQYIVCLQIFVHILTHIFMSMHTYWLVSSTDKKYLYRRVMPGPMIQFNQNSMPEWETVQNFHEMDIWCGRRRSVIFYFITSLICCIGMIGMMFVPMVLCRQTS